MSTTLHVGRHRVQTLASSDATAAIPPGSVTVTLNTTICQATVDPVTNNVTITGVGVGSTTAQYASPGFVNGTDAINVIAAPSIIVTDGPEV